ncbi:MAG TPA: diguanylate cyclase [Terriglobales bacterium]|jgi:two-component system, cell cycle response regulator|nr:diguanylate cyclase [Terriglobales bacterium]
MSGRLFFGRAEFNAAEAGCSTRTQALVVDDSAVYRKLIGDHLRSWGFGVTLANSGSEAWQILEQPDSPKLVLLDWVLPDLDGLEVCQRIRKAGSSRPYVYVILLTSNEGRQNMLEAMQAGADDYLVKPFDELELKARLLVGKRILDLQEELVSARESMRHAATHDSLTGLMNRGEILALLERELERARRERNPVGVILGDIDHFKTVNDTLGHLFGDEALREIGRRLRAQLRVYDGVGRYGGEEFLMILPNCDLANALQRANELREIIAGAPVVCSGKERLVTMSMGVAVSAREGKNEVESLLNQADAGLYAAKEKGRNRIEHFAPTAKKAVPARARKS